MYGDRGCMLLQRIAVGCLLKNGLKQCYYMFITIVNVRVLAVYDC